jgi:hypothetical protein
LTHLHVAIYFTRYNIVHDDKCNRDLGTGYKAYAELKRNTNDETVDVIIFVSDSSGKRFDKRR